MNTPLNLKELERKAFRSFYQDGIWDIFFGLMMLAMYTFTFFDTFENKALRILGMLFQKLRYTFIDRRLYLCLKFRIAQPCLGLPLKLWISQFDTDYGN